MKKRNVKFYGPFLFRLRLYFPQTNEMLVFIIYFFTNGIYRNVYRFLQSLQVQMLDR